MEDILSWVTALHSVEPQKNFYCATRDTFQARLDTFRLTLEKETSLRYIAPLLIAVTGEIGNNSFDHNLGHWRDIPGVYFRYDIADRKIICADRGQGVLATLRKIRPKIQNAQEALHVAFTEKISGRSPEQRGNGLKFVRTVVKERHWHLDMRSGDAQAIINAELIVGETTPSVRGCYVIIHF